MSFRRSLNMMAHVARNDVQPHLRKMWMKHNHVDGEITRHVSPFEQEIVKPLLKDAFHNMIHKIVQFARDAGPALIAGGYVYYWAEKKHAEIAMHHRH